MDPLTLMLMASGQQQPGMGQMLNPAGSMPMGGAAQPVSIGAAMGANPAAGAAPQQQSIGDMLSGIKAPQAEAPKFSGGVSGSGLPYVGRMEDMINPFLQATGAGKGAPMLPTLGALLSQAPGGGR